MTCFVFVDYFEIIQEEKSLALNRVIESFFKQFLL
jgi:hypothetical protein